MLTEQTWQSIRLSPYAFFDPKTGEVLEKDEILNDLKTDLKNMASLVEWQLKSNPEGLLKDIDSYGQQAAAAGLYMGIKLPEEIKETIFTKGKTGISRFEKIFQGEIVSHLRSWKARIDATDGTSVKYLSAGWKRTARSTAPTVSPQINCGFADNQYSEWKDFGELHLVVQGKRVGLLFSIPKRIKEGRLSSPKILLKDNEIVFDFAVGNPYQQGPISTTRFVGVDVGKVHLATVTVIEQDGRVIEESFLSRRVRRLEKSVAATEKQIRDLNRKIMRFRGQSYSKRYREIVVQREKLKGKRRELAIVSAQEVASIAFSHGNAVVIAEDLSWVENTMQNGRWIRGMFIHWLKHFLEMNGSRLLKMNAANSSQDCSECHSHKSVRVRSDRTVKCSDCGYFSDRDLNASRNMAWRGIRSVLKMDSSRRKNKRFCPKRSKKRSAKPHSVLKYPGRDRKKTKPTRSRPKDSKIIISEEVNDLLDTHRAERFSAANVRWDGKEYADRDPKKAVLENKLETQNILCYLTS